MDALAIVTAICPELAKSNSADVFLQMARENTSRDFFGTQYQYAVAYRACHLFKVTAGAVGNDAVGVGKVASMTEGGLSVSYQDNSNGSVSDGGLDTTKYGKMLLGLIKSRPRMGVNTAGLKV